MKDRIEFTGAFHVFAVICKIIYQTEIFIETFAV